MLAELKIENFALIKELEVSFHRGLNVITGESGAGKSLIVESLSFVLGARIKSARFAGDKMVRVQGVFRLPGNSPGFIKDLLDQGLVEPGEMLVLMRRFSPGGRNTYHINGNIVPQNLYRRVGESLVDIHGQRDSQFLLDTANQLALLDMTCGNEGKELLKSLGGLAREYRQALGNLSRLRDTEMERQRRMDYLSFEIDEISRASIIPGEDQQLERQRTILTNAEKISRLGGEVYDALSGDRGAIEQANQASGLLNRWARLDPGVEEITGELERALEIFQHVSTRCRELAEECAFDQGRLDSVMERLHTLEKLKRKYGPALDDVLKYLKESTRRLEEIQNSRQAMEDLQVSVREIIGKWQKTAGILSDIRKKNGSVLQEKILQELRSLGMENAQFIISITGEGDSPAVLEEEPPEIRSRGYDKVEFIISANPGHQPGPLSMIASGGELSRVMLALKNVFASFRDFSTLVLDEIDVGMGGITAQAVGSKLSEISRHRQVICVTHQPVIAAMADVHFQIQKASPGEGSPVEIYHLAGTNRVEEVARMISGHEAVGESKKVAKKLLKGKA